METIKLDKDQLVAAHGEENQIIVMAAAASGKTRLISERVRYRVEDCHDNPANVVVITFTIAAAGEMKNRIEPYPGMFVGTFHGLCYKWLSAKGYRAEAEKFINKEKFDELFNLLTLHQECIQYIENLVIDEAQDMDEEMWELIFNYIKPRRLFAVGDFRQCQPAGTKILLRDGIIKNIEDIIPGDSVVYYDESACRCAGLKTQHNSIIKRVEKVNVRDFCNDSLITIHTEDGKSSTYTPNHRTYVKLNRLENKHVVYLMCDQNYRFRVGKIPLFYKGDRKYSPWREKMRQEGCHKIWLLKYFDTDQRARVEEQKISYKYSIPQVCWQTDKVSWTIEDLNYIYEGLNTYETAKRCLNDYGFNIDYPLLDIDVDWQVRGHYASNATVQIYAANFISEFMSALIYNPSLTSNKNYEVITSVKKTFVTEPIKVYSLQVEGGNYIADSIVTHNCIYDGFRNVNHNRLLQLASVTSTKVYELNNNYRNHEEVLDFAKAIMARYVQAGYTNKYIDRSIPMRGPGGEVKDYRGGYEIVKDIIKESLVDNSFDKWFIIAPTNTEADNIQKALDELKIPWNRMTRAGLSNEQLGRLLLQNKVIVGTIHSVKGLERDNVIVFHPKFWGNGYRLSYVAATRARNRLFWIRNANSKRTIQ